MSSLAGIGLKILSTLFFAVMLAIIKYLSDMVPTGEIIFARSFFALIPLFIMAIMQGNWRDCIRTQHPWLHVRRSMVGAMAMFLWFSSLKYLPLPEATAISFAAPLTVVVLAALFLKETVRLYRWTAVVAGLLGVLVIVWPRLSASNVEAGDMHLIGVIFAAASTFFMGLATILIRQMTKSEKNVAIIFYFFISASFLSLLSLYWGWVWPDWQSFGLLVLSGLFGGLGQIAMTQAVRLSEASLIAPFDYTNMIWALIIGIFLFDEYPSPAVMIGGTIVIVAGLFVIFRERQLGMRRKMESRLREL